MRPGRTAASAALALLTLLSGRADTDPLQKKTQDLREAVRNLEAYPSPEQARKLVDERRESLARARKQALKFIFDTTIYPDEDHGKEGQPRIDEETDRVATFFAPGETLVKPEGPVGKLLADAHALADGLEAAGAKDLPAVPDAASMAKRVDEVLFKVRASPKDLETMAANRKALAKNDPEMAACIEATNRYRIMMGLPALLVNEKLMAAAQKHSEDMVKRDFFDHKNPDGLSPQERVKAQGYKGPVAENISFGRTSGEAVVMGWRHSSGHHRNLLRPECKTVGVGRAGTKWTMDLGE